MKKDLTELVFIMDCSGSMSGLEADTIGGFNGMIRKQKEEQGEALVSTVLFNTRTRVLHDRVRLEDIQPMTSQDYTVGGCTALMDALGGAIHHIRNIHKYAREEDVPEHTLFVITTDGMENASRNFSSDEIKAMIRQMKEEKQWEFLFLAANIDAVETASRVGISEERAASFHCDAEGTSAIYSGISDAVSNIRSNRPLTGRWREGIDKDFRNRAKR